ncbi:unnamed protein product [Caenorhabditis sp. 36 PRJEB53466]|nr:unnamed protein product [Caenorhabditis sp. 36 PRJEB53466]
MTILHAGYPQPPAVHFGRHHHLNLNHLDLNKHQVKQVHNHLNNSAVGGGGAAFQHLHTPAAPIRHVACSDDDEPRGGIAIGAGGGR